MLRAKQSQPVLRHCPYPMKKHRPHPPSASWRCSMHWLGGCMGIDLGSQDQSRCLVHSILKPLCVCDTKFSQLALQSQFCALSPTPLQFIARCGLDLRQALPRSFLTWLRAEITHKPASLSTPVRWKPQKCWPPGPHDKLSFNYCHFKTRVTAH